VQKPLQPSTSTFRDLIEGGYLYVDKTQYIYELVQGTKGIYFLSRPRRFGKSLLISTLDEVFRGNQALFEGLRLYERDYQWQVYPVIRLDFSTRSVESATELRNVIDIYLKRIAREHDIKLGDGSHDIQLDDLILALSEKDIESGSGKGKVVILIDEYDKPLIDNLSNIEEAEKIQNVMRGFYGAIKAMDRHIRFVFITGVSKFSKVSIFSELNNLTDLTMRTSFSAALGLTETELRHYFAERIPAFAEQEGLSPEALLDKIRQWYDGFCFAPDGENVYNPFSTMQLFDAQQFSNYWFESGTPSFLIKLIKERRHDLQRFKEIKVREISFSTYDIKSLAITPLLYQTGYLTIKAYEPKRQRYTLSYPNREVEASFLVWLMGEYSYMERGISESYIWELIDALEEGNLDEMFKILGVFFANIPYDLHVKHEKYYHTIFYLLFMLVGFRTTAEVQTNDGRIDAVVEVPDHIYLFEFKMDKSADDALTQIENHQYYQKYQLHGKPITLVGENFDSKTRTVDDWTPKKVTS